MSEGTLFDTIWGRHLVDVLPDGDALLHVDRHFLHDLEASPRMRRLRQRGLGVRRPDLSFATADHAVSTLAGRDADTSEVGARLLHDMRRLTAEQGIRLFDLDRSGSGIVHVIGPELGLSLPGTLIVCGDSHTCTHGGLGALAFGIGSSEVEHVLATQTIRQRKPRVMQLAFDGPLAPGACAKDMILHAIGRFGTAAAQGFAIEYCGQAVAALDIEQRLTLCNLSIEMGAKFGMVAPDERTFAWIEGRRFAPRGPHWSRALADWRGLRSSARAVYDRQLRIDCRDIGPQVTWGTSPEQVIDIDGRVPDPADAATPQRRQAIEDALAYMGLRAGQPIRGTRIDRVFIGSCANGRLSDLRAAAAAVAGQRLAPHVRAWVVAGSHDTRVQAEAEGLDQVFRGAGFEWRMPGCSMCLAANGETVEPGARCVSTSNRNFVGRQGPGARTHLASPALAAASAIAGVIEAPPRR